MNRMLGLLAVLAFIGANSALILRDLLPTWLAGDPPPPGAQDLRPGWNRLTQTGVFNAQDERIGSIWTEMRSLDASLLVASTTLLDVIEVSEEVLTPRLRIDTVMLYQGDNELKTLQMEVHGFGMPIGLRGEYVPPDQFPCKWQVGEHRGSFVLPSSATRAMGSALGPFGSFGELRVGQTWRMELFNPLNHVLPGLQGGSATRSVIVRVVGRRNVMHNGLGVKVYVLEADRIRAWVSPLGRVLRQEVHLPFFGKLTLLEEPFDLRAYREARQTFSNEP
jgi:hypothetical protein